MGQKYGRKTNVGLVAFFMRISIGRYGRNVFSKLEKPFLLVFLAPKISDTNYPRDLERFP
jgi:hypothetical protein